MKSMIATFLLSTTYAFAPSTKPRVAFPKNNKLRPLTATMTREELTGLSTEEQLNILGVKEDELALGIDADEVLEFIGTKQDLLDKFQADLPDLTPSETEIEVSKYLMDGEMLDMTIKYYQRKAEDPTWEPMYPKEESNPLIIFFNIFSQYAIWIALGIILKDVVTGYFSKGGADAAM